MALSKLWPGMLPCIGLALALVLAAGRVGAAAESGAPALSLRIGEHPGFSRLVFDWPERIGYRIEQGAERAVVRFERAARLDLRHYRADPPVNLRGLEPLPGGGGLNLTLALPEGATLRHFYDGPKVVIDVYAPAPKAQAKSQAKAKPKAKPKAETSSPPPEIGRAAVSGTTAEHAAESPPAGDSPLELAAKARPGLRDEAAAALEATSRSKTKATPSGLVAAYERPPLPVLEPVPGRRAARREPLVLRLSWSDSVAAAAFRRGRHLWLVFDAPTRAKLARQIETVAPELKPVEQWTDDGATVLRFAAGSGLAPRLSREEGAWRIDLRPRLGLPDRNIAYRILSRQRRSEVVFSLEGASRVIRLSDPDLGGRLFVVPVVTAGLGLPVTRHFPQFQALDSYQGLVVAPLSDAVLARLEGAKLRVTGNAGLLVTPELSPDPLLAGEGGGPLRGRLLHLEAWRRGGEREYPANRQALQRAVVAPADPEKLDLARLDLARFYFAHGFGAEALAVLDLMMRSNERFARDPELILLRAAGGFLTQDYAAASPGLADPALAGEADALVWRAALAAVAQDWAYGAELFERAEPLIDEYPRAVRVRLRLLAAEARLGVADTGGASLYLERIREDRPTGFELAQLDYVEGRRLLLDNEVVAATELWRAVARSSHRPSQARARLALVELGLESGSLGEAEAIAELERLRFLWRGDEFEVALLERLAGLYVKRGDTRKALHALRQAASHFPGSAHAKAAARRMTEIFVALYLDEPAPALPPLTALALFEEFRELTPAGKRGDRMIESLVDRLVAVDLLDRAAGLLQAQIDQRLEGAERLRAGNRLALIRLIDHEPQLALEALAAAAPRPAPGVSPGDSPGDSSEGEPVPDPLPPALLREARHLAARAHADLRRGREALDRLRGDSSYEAQRLRADILWELGDWPAAAVALARFLPALPPAGQHFEAVEAARAVIDLAIAHTLAGDRQALDALARDYGPAMAATSEAEAFALLTSDFGRPQITAITEELAGVDRVQAFMAGYKARLAEAGLSGVN
jgi:hypothetical protein